MTPEFEDPQQQKWEEIEKQALLEIESFEAKKEKDIKALARSKELIAQHSQRDSKMISDKLPLN